MNITTMGLTAALRRRPNSGFILGNEIANQDKLPDCGRRSVPPAIRAAAELAIVGPAGRVHRRWIAEAERVPTNFLDVNRTGYRYRQTPKSSAVVNLVLPVAWPTGFWSKR